MRRCARAEELREALAAEAPLDASLNAHVATCPECARIAAGARRFESRLDLAMAELVTDALPPSIVMAARTAPPAAGRRRARILASTILAAAVLGFAVIGAVATGTSVSDAILGGGPDRGSSPSGALPAVDCYLGEPVVDVVGGSATGEAPQVMVAYCIGEGSSTASAGTAITCVRAFEVGARIGPREDDERGYLGACMRVEEAGSTELPAEAPSTASPPMPFPAWADAAAAVVWPVAQPRWLPDGYGLAALQGITSTGTPGTIDTVIATYLRAGVPLSLEQFTIADPDAFHVELALPGTGLRDVTTGQTPVNGSPAFWASGIDVATGHGPESNVDALVLAWRDDAVGYRITARDLDLETVRRVAESIGDEEARRIQAEAAMLEQRAELARR